MFKIFISCVVVTTEIFIKTSVSFKKLLSEVVDYF